MKPFDDEIVAYYEDLAAATGAPLMVYNWVHGTAVDMNADLVPHAGPLAIDLN